MPRQTGHMVPATVQGLNIQAFVPAPLPPEPPIDWSTDLFELRDEAHEALGRLDGISRILPDNRMFLYQYVRKEALLSSQIEGTQSSLTDLFLYELDGAPGVPIDDVEEVSNYIAAMNYGLDRMKAGFPLSLRLIREIHAVLLRGGRGRDQEPGEFRRSQVFIGSANPASIDFVPPPPNLLMECLDPFERFLHDQPERTPTLLKAALAHVQFETIHPFKDGNGRLGRLLITLLLCAEARLSEPLLYLSLYLKQHRDAYYQHLQGVRQLGDWEGWLQFFFAGVRDTSRQAVETAERLMSLFSNDRERLQTLGKAAGTAVRVHQRLQERVALNISSTAEALSLSWPAVSNALQNMEEMGLVQEVTGNKRNRTYVYRDYMAILAEGTEPLGR